MRRPATYLLDSTVLIDAGQAREPAQSWLASVIQSPARIVISTVTLVEVTAGVAQAERDRTTRFLRTFEAWPVTDGIAIRAGTYRHDLARQGFDLKLADAIIAVTAEVARAVLVTDNVKDFQRLALPLLRPGDR